MSNLNSSDPASQDNSGDSEPWTAVVLAVLPFLMPALVLLGPPIHSLYAAVGLDYSQIRIAGSLLAIAQAFSVLGALLVGWLRGFPRWTYPYLGFVFVSSLLMANSSTPGLWLFGYDHGRELWGLLAWVPLLVVAATAVLILLVRQPVKQQFRLLSNIWHDWTLLSFAIYGSLSVGTYLVMDEIHSPWEQWFRAAGAVLLALGAAAYMLAPTMPWRVAALFAGFTLALNVMSSFSTYYWQTQTHIRTYFTPTWAMAMTTQGIIWFYGLLFLFSPALIGLLHRSRRRLRFA